MSFSGIKVSDPVTDWTDAAQHNTSMKHGGVDCTFGTRTKKEREQIRDGTQRLPHFDGASYKMILYDTQ